MEKPGSQNFLPENWGGGGGLAATCTNITDHL